MPVHRARRLADQFVRIALPVLASFFFMAIAGTAQAAVVAFNFSGVLDEDLGTATAGTNFDGFFSYDTATVQSTQTVGNPIPNEFGNFTPFTFEIRVGGESLTSLNSEAELFRASGSSDRFSVRTEQLLPTESLLGAAIRSVALNFTIPSLPDTVNLPTDEAFFATVTQATILFTCEISVQRCRDPGAPPDLGQFTLGTVLSVANGSAAVPAAPALPLLFCGLLVLRSLRHQQ